MMHRAIYEGAKACLFYQFHRTNDDPGKENELRSAAKNMCDMMKAESAHKAFDGNPLASSDSPTPFWVQITEPSNPDDHLLYWYRYWSGSYWLLVMDKHPDRTDDPYPIDLRFFCNIPNIYDDFRVINNRYGVTQKNDGRGTTIPSRNATPPVPIPTGQFREFWARYENAYQYELGLRRGEVKLFRFFN